MYRRYWLFTMATVGAALAASAASADIWPGQFAGSICSFADNPLASHNKIHHRFKNTSGASQWVTCPIPRSTLWQLEWLGMEIGGTSTDARFEQRAPLLGTLSGWDASVSEGVDGGTRFRWFDGTTNGASDAYSAYAFEVKLDNNAFVSYMRMDEGEKD